MPDAVGYLMSGVERGLIGRHTAADTSKALASVHHLRLLENAGCCGIEPHWLQDWLSGHGQPERGGNVCKERGVTRYTTRPHEVSQ